MRIERTALLAATLVLTLAVLPRGEAGEVKLWSRRRARPRR